MTNSASAQTFLERFAPLWFLGLLGLVGLVVVIGGVVASRGGADLSIVKDLCLGLGSTIFGSALGAGVGLLTGQRLEGRVAHLNDELGGSINRFRDEIRALVKPPWIADKAKLQQFRTVMHKYHRTDEGKGPFWIHTSLDFSTSFVDDGLYASQVINLDESFEYDVQGFLIDDRRLILAQKAKKHDEPVALEVYKDAGILVRKEVWGLAFHTRFTNKDTLDPCLLLPSIIPDTRPNARQSDDLCQKLNKKWEELSGFKAGGIKSMFV